MNYSFHDSIVVNASHIMDALLKRPEDLDPDDWNQQVFVEHPRLDMRPPTLPIVMPLGSKDVALVLRLAEEARALGATRILIITDTAELAQQMCDVWQKCIDTDCKRNVTEAAYLEDLGDAGSDRDDVVFLHQAAVKRALKTHPRWLGAYGEGEPGWVVISHTDNTKFWRPVICRFTARGAGTLVHFNVRTRQEPGEPFFEMLHQSTMREAGLCRPIKQIVYDHGEPEVNLLQLAASELSAMRLRAQEVSPNRWPVLVVYARDQVHAASVTQQLQDLAGHHQFLKGGVVNVTAQKDPDGALRQALKECTMASCPCWGIVVHLAWRDTSAHNVGVLLALRACSEAPLMELARPLSLTADARSTEIWTHMITIRTLLYSS